MPDCLEKLPRPCLWTLEGISSRNNWPRAAWGWCIAGSTRRLNRTVAIKFLSERLGDPAGRRRFQREAQTASSLNHPNILTIHDAGELDGRQYLVMEFVDGETLTSSSQRERRAWRQAVELLAGVADGLAAAHDAGILHRDIKPANILVATNGYAKLADFGLAKLEEPGGADEGLDLSGNEPFPEH